MLTRILFDRQARLYQSHFTIIHCFTRHLLSTFYGLGMVQGAEIEQ
jgi:hypothetical protein